MTFIKYWPYAYGLKEHTCAVFTDTNITHFEAPAEQAQGEKKYCAP